MTSGRITKGVHGSTFGGNPLACAVALTTLDILEREALPERAARLGTYALERLRALRTPLIREVRGRGLLLGIELSRRAQPYLEALFEGGVLALPAGPNVIRLLPPLVIQEEQLERALDVLEEVLTNRDRPHRASQERAIPAPDAMNTVPTEGIEAREVSLLYTMLTIPSYSGQESALAHYLVEQAQQMGLHAHVDDAGNFIASTHAQFDESQTDAPPIILLGHMDTVGGNIPVRIENGILYGRGAVDAKGPLAAFVCATARLARSGSLHHPIIVIGAVEEEAATSRGARAVVDRYSPAACIIGEPSGSQAVTIGYKGRLLVECCLTRSIGHTAGPQQSSCEVATDFWERVRTSAQSWNEQHAANSAFVALTPSLRTITSSQDGLEEQTHFLIGYRLPPGYDIEELQQQLERWAQEEDISVSFSGQEVAFHTTRTTSLARAFLAAIRATGKSPSFKHKTGTSDMNVVGPAWGQNIVAYGPGDSRLDHTPQEHIELAEYTHAIDVLELVLRECTIQNPRNVGSPLVGTFEG
jgi:N-acetyl-ornithine/N-acetyl-lysine deacetylase